MTFKALPFAAACLALAIFAPLSRAAVVINIGSAHLSDSAGTALQAGTLLQLINLGGDGVLNPIDLNDGNVSGLGRWVSGDDTVLNIPFQAIVGPTPVPGDFASTKAFDLQFNVGVVPDSTPGFLERSFQFAFSDLPAGVKLGLRWFPGLLAKDFDSITLAAGQTYGQFTRQAPAQLRNQGQYWLSPNDAANITFDPLITNSAGGSEANSAGVASLVIPEPAAIGMSLLGAAGLAMLRRRRA